MSLSLTVMPTKDEKDYPVCTISIIAELLNVHQRTLRIYDDAKILVPRRTINNKRLYSMKDIEKGKFIHYLTRNLGINIAGVKIILHILEKSNIDIEKSTEYLNEIALKLDISFEKQCENKIKLSRRGRKPSF